MVGMDKVGDWMLTGVARSSLISLSRVYSSKEYVDGTAAENQVGTDVASRAW